MLAKPPGKNPKPTAVAAGSLFFPQTKSLGIDQTDLSPALQQKVCYAGIAGTSYEQGREMLLKLADLSVSTKQVERLTDRIGQERVAQRDAAVAAFVELPLVEKFAVPSGTAKPPAVAVMCDGGRIQILDRQAAEKPTTQEVAREPTVDEGGFDDPPKGEVAGETTVGKGSFDDDAPKGKGRSKHWREDKIAILLKLDSEVSAEDPCPDLPTAFVDPLRIIKLVRELGKGVKEGQEAAEEPVDGQGEADALQEDAKYEPPEVLSRKVLATRAAWPDFAPMVASAARQEGFQGASRKAFVADGSANNWTLQRRFFGSFEPVLDFIHGLAYVYAGALAGRTFGTGWLCYQRWIGLVWKGEVGKVIEELRVRQAELGVPLEDDAEGSPQQVVKKSLGYLSNHQDKMKYPEYLEAGLPVTSSLMESTVKQMNTRVKGSEKFWSEEGAEGILQLRADDLSDDQPLEQFWKDRQTAASGQRRYRRSAG